MKYRKKPVVIEAVRLLWENQLEILDFTNSEKSGCYFCYVNEEGRISEEVTDRLGMMIPTLEGDHLALEGDFIIRGVEGELYPCKLVYFLTLMS